MISHSYESYILSLDYIFENDFFILNTASFISLFILVCQVELIQISTPSLIACIDCATIPKESLRKFAQQLGPKMLILHACEQASQ